MMATIEEVWAHEVNEDVLLGGSGVRMSTSDWEVEVGSWFYCAFFKFSTQVIVSAVAHFVQSTGRKV